MIQKLANPKKISIDWENINTIPPEQICTCSKEALTHDGYMTSYLQNSRHCRLHIEKLWQYYDNNILDRSIFMLDQSNHCHVIANIKIFLQAFSPIIKKQIIESNVPFGRILDEAGIVPTFKQRHYFTLPEILPNHSVTPYRQCCHIFFGRSHKMFNQEGDLLAEIWEVLP